MRFFSGSFFLALCRAVFGGAFVWAAWAKIIDPASFAVAVANYDLLPHGAVGFTAAVLPWIEMICGVLLIIGIWVAGNALVLNTLLLVFTGALAMSMFRGLDIACGCFSLDVQASESHWYYLLRDVAMLGLGFWIWTQTFRKNHGSAEKAS
ncbi:MAG: DoxX family protein [Desulfobacteraceae bacterium]|nr:DoxX family protein [Desulfobacteraceae bacterium]